VRQIAALPAFRRCGCNGCKIRGFWPKLEDAVLKDQQRTPSFRPWIKNSAPPIYARLLPELTVYRRGVFPRVKFPERQLRPLIFPAQGSYRVIRQCCSYLTCCPAPTAFVALADPINRLRERHPSRAFTLGFRKVLQSCASDALAPMVGGAAARSEFGR